MKDKLLIITVVLVGIMATAACSRDIIDITEHTPVVELSIDGTVWKDRFTVEVKPDKYAGSYSYALATATDRAAFEQGTLTGIIEVSGTEPTTVEFGDLQSGESYTVYAQAIDSEGRPGPVASLMVSTDILDMNFSLQYVTNSSVGIDINIPEEFPIFEFAIGLPDERPKFESKELESYSTRTESFIYTANFFDLEPETDYVFFMRAYDRNDNPTQIYEFPLRTRIADECPEVALDILTQDIYEGDYVFTPNAHCSKFVMVVTSAGGYDGIWQNDLHWRGDMMTMIASWALNENDPSQIYKTYTSTRQLDFALTTPALEADHAIDAFFLLYDNDEKPFGIQKIRFTTPQYDDTLVAGEVKIEISKITPNGATFIFTADPNTVGFFFDTVEADWYDDMEKNDPTWHKNFLRDLFLERGFYFAHTGEEKTITWTDTSVPTSGFRCYIAVCPMNANGVSDPDWGKLQLVGFTTTTE